MCLYFKILYDQCKREIETLQSERRIGLEKWFDKPKLPPPLPKPETDIFPLSILYRFDGMVGR